MRKSKKTVNLSEDYFLYCHFLHTPYSGYMIFTLFFWNLVVEFPNTKTVCILQQTELAILHPLYGCMHCRYIMAMTLMKSNTQIKKLKFAYVITKKTNCCNTCMPL